MKIVSTVNDVRSTVKEWKKNGLKVGLVPTRAFYMRVHLSLIKKAVAERQGYSKRICQSYSVWS